VVLTDNVERVLTDIDANDRNFDIDLLRHGVLLVFGAPGQLQSAAGQEHGRTIPLADIRPDRGRGGRRGGTDAAITMAKIIKWAFVSNIAHTEMPHPGDDSFGLGLPTREAEMQRFVHNENIALYKKLVAESEYNPSRDEDRTREAEMQRFVHNENIALYKKLVAESEYNPSRDEDRHKILLILLAEETAKDKKLLAN
jgi:hypothetical protein